MVYAQSSFHGLYGNWYAIETSRYHSVVMRFDFVCRYRFTDPTMNRSNDWKLFRVPVQNRLIDASWDTYEERDRLNRIEYGTSSSGAGSSSLWNDRHIGCALVSTVRDRERSDQFEIKGGLTGYSSWLTCIDDHDGLAVAADPTVVPRN